MTKHLYLVRHAEAASREARQEDKTRNLTQNGIKDSLLLGTWLRERNLSFDRIVSSSASRAEQTAHVLTEGLKLNNPTIIVEDVLYEASPGQLLHYINDFEAGFAEVMVVGHNPSISYLAEYLTKADIGNMAPGSAACIQFECDGWKSIAENTGELVWYTAPPFDIPSSGETA